MCHWHKMGTAAGIRWNRATLSLLMRLDSCTGTPGVSLLHSIRKAASRKSASTRLDLPACPHSGVLQVALSYFNEGDLDWAAPLNWEALAIEIAGICTCNSGRLVPCKSWGHALQMRTTV